MLVGFDKSTIHFCEPNRPNAWPAGYDQSLLYPIVALTLWQQSLIVLTQGFPSSGTGNSPAQYTFAQIQAAEPCISRGSVVTTLAGVYYASANGLVALNYFGAQNQTLTVVTRKSWLEEFKARSLIACRHRAQYLAVNGTGVGFIIDYAEQRLGVVSISTCVDVISVWNDVFTDATYMIASNKVYLWDSELTKSLVYSWKSREFWMAAPTTLGACQVTLDQSVTNPAPPGHVMPATDLVLPDGVNALCRVFAGDKLQLVLEQKLTKPTMIFRLPSGFKSFAYQFELVSRVPISSVELASTMKELKGV